MKRLLTAGAVVAASFGLVLGVAGTAAAQTPFGKYPTQVTCIQMGRAHTDNDADFVCAGPHANSSSQQKWWLYVLG